MTDADARIAALEAQVAQLLAERGTAPAAPAAPERPSSYDRRALLRGGLAVAAGAALVPALARPAAAANGQPVVIGTDNTGTATTRLTSAVPNGATLALANTSTAADPQDPDAQIGFPALRIEPSTGVSGPDFAAARAGDVLLSGEMFWLTHVSSEGGTPSVTGQAHTSAFATYTDFLTPTRALDTRQAGGTTGNAGRTNIINTPATAFDEQGRLRGGQTLTLDLSDYVFEASGVVGNVTVAGSAGNGFLTVYPGGQTRPGTSNLNYTRGQVLANQVTVGLSGTGTNILTVSIYTSQPAHILFDVFAFHVYEFGAINPDFEIQSPRVATGRRRMVRG